MTPGSWYLDTAVVCAVVGALLGWLMPSLVARLPEPPAAAADPVTGDDAGVAGDRGPPSARGGPKAETKELYADLAALPGLRWKMAGASAVAAGLLGARVGWSPALPFLVYLAPVGVALSVVDWRTRLLPYYLVAPSYAVVLLLGAGASALTGEWSPFLRMLLGGLAGWSVFYLVHLGGRVFLRGNAFGRGDVRLAGVLGMALGWFGLAAWGVGLYAGFLLGGVVGTGLAVLRVVDRRGYPFGPFMLAGALVGLLLAPQVAAWYA